MGLPGGGGNNWATVYCEVVGEEGSRAGMEVVLGDGHCGNGVSGNSYSAVFFWKPSGLRKEFWAWGGAIVFLKWQAARCLSPPQGRKPVDVIFKGLDSIYLWEPAPHCQMYL